MGFWKRVFGGEGKGDITSSLDLFREIYGGGRESRSGVAVNTLTALEVPTILALTRVISDGVSQVPFHLYRETDGRKTVASDHPLDQVLYRRPNTWQTSFEFRETLMFHSILAGNAFVFINRVGIDRVIRELIVIEPHRVSVKQNPDYSLEYTVTSDQGATKTFGQDAIWHLRGPSWNSWMGMEAIKLARNAIGLSISLEQGQSDFQKNGAKTSGLFSVKEKLSPEKYAMLRAWFEDEINKSSNYRPLILDQGGEYTPFTMTGVDQQLLETRKHQIEELCRAFRVMPLMIGHPADMAARAATESIFLQHVIHTLMPWYQRIEQSAEVNLLSEDERKAGYFIKLNPKGLMRGALKDQADYYAKALGSGGTKGWMTQNDVRDAEDMDRSDDPKADELPQPTTKQPPTTPPTPDPASEENNDG